MAREELGTKRVCPETHKKFYDLNKDPIVSPYTGKEYARSFFEEVAPVKVRREASRPVREVETPEEEVEEEDELEDESGPEFVSLEDAEEDDSDTETTSDDADDEELPDLPDVDLEVDEDEDATDDAFLEDEEEDDDLSDVIGGVEGEDEV